MIKMTILFSCLIIIFTGCSIQNELIRDFNTFEKSLYYVHDSEFHSDKNNISVVIDSISAIEELPYNANVTVLKKPPIPLLFNIYTYGCELGKINYEEDLRDFLKESYVIEAYRAGNFIVNPDSLQKKKIRNEYDLSISVNELSVIGPYQYSESSNFHWEQAGPAVATCSMDFLLEDEDTILLEDNIISTQTNVFLNQSNIIKPKSFYLLREKYTVAMVEALSFTINNCIAELVEKINKYLIENEEHLEIIEVVRLDDFNSFMETTVIEGKTVEVDMEHLIVVLDDYNEVIGKLIKVDKHFVTLEYLNILNVIKRKRILEILDSNRNDIMEQALNRKDFKRVNYNSYFEVKEFK
ncbi:MAG: hypothetical protein HOD64_09575 [Candidatus Cloacimonetes bacterium]|nr:hypothetical protein [Candidatus Cloacimonadota bacterium]